MKKADMISKVAEITGSKKTAEGSISCVFDLIRKGLKKRGSICRGRIWKF